MSSTAEPIPPLTSALLSPFWGAFLTQPREIPAALKHLQKQINGMFFFSGECGFTQVLCGQDTEFMVIQDGTVEFMGAAFEIGVGIDLRSVKRIKSKRSLFNLLLIFM